MRSLLCLVTRFEFVRLSRLIAALAAEVPHTEESEIFARAGSTAAHRSRDVSCDEFEGCRGSEYSERIVPLRLQP